MAKVNNLAQTDYIEALFDSSNTWISRGPAPVMPVELTFTKPSWAVSATFAVQFNITSDNTLNNSKLVNGACTILANNAMYSRRYTYSHVYPLTTMPEAPYWLNHHSPITGGGIVSDTMVWFHSINVPEDKLVIRGLMKNTNYTLNSDGSQNKSLPPVGDTQTWSVSKLDEWEVGLSNPGSSFDNYVWLKLNASVTWSAQTVA